MAERGPYNKKHDVIAALRERYPHGYYNTQDYRKVYREVNKDRIKEYNSSEKRKKSARDRARSQKIAIIEYKGGKCEHCGRLYDGENAVIFDFHHLDDSTKSFTLNPFTRKIEDLKAEADKCVLVCATCHRYYHRNEKI